MNDAALQECVRDVDVFARASPEHKLRLVKAIQANGQIVAMTGDGVNDAPALKKADIGVAMGIKGTEVTKEAAGMILADDNFASISAAVKEGRTVYNNIEKAMLFLLPTNVAQGAVIGVAILFAFTLPITAPQVLWVNMVTSVALGLVISFEPHEADVMRHPPRAVGRPIVTGFGIWRILFVGAALLLYTLAAFFWMKEQGASIRWREPLPSTPSRWDRCSTCSTVVICSIHPYRCAPIWTTPISGTASSGVAVLQLLFTYAPPFQAIFDTEALPLRAWLWLIGGGLIFFFVVEMEKFVIRSIPTLRGAATFR